MRLYKITPRLFTKKDYRTGDFWQTMAVEVGTIGGPFTHVIIPVEGHDFDSDKWQIVPSRSGRPKIVLGELSSSGHIAVLSSRRPFGRKVGDVFVSISTLESITVLAHGIGGRIETGEKWNEYIAAIYGGATIYVEGNSLPDELLVFSDSDVITHPNPEPVDFREYVSLSSGDVRKWLREQ